MILLERGADINHKGPGGRTALIDAAARGNSRMVQVLFKKGFGVNDVNGSSGNALTAAAAMGHTEAVQILLEGGADPDFIGPQGKTALHTASESNECQIIEVLIEHGAKIDHENHEGETALFVASESLQMQTVRLLLENGAEVDHENHEGKTALFAASRHICARGMILFLLEKGAKINHQSCSGSTALMKAVRPLNLWNVEDLLQASADPSLVDDSGNTALGIARHRGYAGIDRLFIQRLSFTESDWDCVDEQGKTLAEWIEEVEVAESDWETDEGSKDSDESIPLTSIFSQWWSTSIPLSDRFDDLIDWACYDFGRCHRKYAPICCCCVAVEGRLFLRNACPLGGDGSEGSIVDQHDEDQDEDESLPSVD